MGKYSSGRGGRAAFKAKQVARAKASIQKHGTASYQYGGTTLTPAQQETAVEKHEEKKEEPKAPTYVYKGKTYTSEAAVKEAIKAETVKKLPEPIKKRYEVARAAEIKREERPTEQRISQAPQLTMRPEDVRPREDILTEEDISKAKLSAQLKMQERIISEPTVEKIAEFGAKIPFLPVSMYLPESIKEKIQPYKEEFIKGMIPVTREEMAKAGLTAAVSFGIGAAAPPAVAGVRLAGVRYISPLLAKVPKIKRAAEVGVGVGGKGATYGITGAYAKEVGARVIAAETVRKGAGAEVLGKEVSTVLVPLGIGGKVGTRLARKTLLKTGMEKQIQELPEAAQVKFRTEFKKTKALKKVEPKDIPLGQIETYPGKKVPKKYEKIITKTLEEEGGVIAGTYAQKAYYPKKFKSTPAHDIDVFFGAKKPAIFKKKTPTQLAKKIETGLKKAGAKDISRKGAEIKMKGAGKILEIHAKKFAEGEISLEAFPYFERLVKTPRGLTIISAREQARRKLTGAYLAGRTKDIPSYKELMLGTRMTAREKKSFFKFFKDYELKAKPLERPKPRITPRETIAIQKQQLELIKRPKKPYKYKTGLKAEDYKAPKIPKYKKPYYKPSKAAYPKTPPYKPPEYPLVKIPPYKPTIYKPPKTPPYRPYRTPPYKPPKYPATLIPPFKTPPYPPYKPPEYPATLIPPFKTPPLKDFEKLQKQELFKDIKGFPQPKQYIPSFTAVALGIKGIPKGLFGKGKVFTGLEMRPLPRSKKKRR